MEKKYKMIPEGNMYRIVALKDFADVKEGDKGGLIEKEDNLSHEGDCWVYYNAKVFDNASVFDNAKVCGNIGVYGNAKICGDAIVEKPSDYIVFKNWWSSGRYFTWTRSNDKWKVGCFYGTGKELIEKAYKDSVTSGREYERIVNYVEQIMWELHCEAKSSDNNCHKLQEELNEIKERISKLERDKQILVPFVQTTDFPCDGIHCDNPRMDCINCPRKVGYGWNTIATTNISEIPNKLKK